MAAIHNRKHKRNNSGLQFQYSHQHKPTPSPTNQLFLERQEKRDGGALLFFCCHRDLWWGRACVLQNIKVGVTKHKGWCYKMWWDCFSYVAMW